MGKQTLVAIGGQGRKRNHLCSLERHLFLAMSACGSSHPSIVATGAGNVSVARPASAVAAVSAMAGNTRHS